MLSIVVASSIAISFLVIAPPISLLGGKFEGLEESLMCLGELSCHLPFEMGFAGLFFPLFEGPWDFYGRIKGRGINDGASKSLGHGMFEGFNGSLVI